MKLPREADSSVQEERARSGSSGGSRFKKRVFSLLFLKYIPCTALLLTLLSGIICAFRSKVVQATKALGTQLQGPPPCRETKVDPSSCQLHTLHNNTLLIPLISLLSVLTCSGAPRQRPPKSHGPMTKRRDIRPRRAACRVKVALLLLRFLLGAPGPPPPFRISNVLSRAALRPALLPIQAGHALARRSGAGSGATAGWHEMARGGGHAHDGVETVGGGSKNGGLRRGSRVARDGGEDGGFGASSRGAAVDRVEGACDALGRANDQGNVLDRGAGGDVLVEARARVLRELGLRLRVTPWLVLRLRILRVFVLL